MDASPVMDNLLRLHACWEYGIIRPFAGHLRRAGLPLSLESYHLLAAAQRSAGLTMSSVAQLLCTTKQQATLKVDRLCEADYLERQADAADRRVVKVVVTPKAQRDLEEYRAIAADYVTALQSRLPRDGLQELNQAMEHLIEALPEAE